MSNKLLKFILKKSGVTLVELVVLIIVASIILLPLSAIITEAIRKTLVPEHYGIASRLAIREMEQVVSKNFGDIAIATTGPNNYTGNFSQYTYKIKVDYVNPGALNTPVLVPDNNDYKRIEITISRTGFEDISLVSLVTNNGDSL